MIKKIDKYIQNNYQKENHGEIFEQYYRNLYYTQEIHSERNIEINSDNILLIHNEQYPVINIIKNGKRFKYYDYDIIKKIILLHKVV